MVVIEKKICSFSRMIQLFLYLPNALRVTAFLLSKCRFRGEAAKTTSEIEILKLMHFKFGENDNTVSTTIVW